eukprot:UN23441
MNNFLKCSVFQQKCICSPSTYVKLQRNQNNLQTNIFMIDNKNNTIPTKCSEIHIQTQQYAGTQILLHTSVRKITSSIYVFSLICFSN